MSRSLGLISIAFTLLSLGCYRQARYDVVQQSPAGLLAGYRKVFVPSIDLRALHVEGVPEPEWFAARGARQQRIYTGDRALLASEFRERLREALAKNGYLMVDQPAADALTLRARVLDYWPGFWAFVGSDAKIRMRVELADAPMGAPLDTIELTDRVKAEMWTASTTNRARRLADAMAGLTARYVAERVRALPVRVAAE
jgi:hypothetical protein